MTDRDEPPATAAVDAAVADDTAVADETAAVAAAGEVAAADPVARRWWRRPVPVRAGVALLLVAAVGSGGYFYLQDRDKQRLLDARESARTAACGYGPVLADYDAKNLDAYFAAVLDAATGDWHKQFESTRTELRDALVQGQVVSEVTDVQCAIRTGDERSAEAIVVLGQTITSVGTQGKPAPGQLSMVMTLERFGDRWLVSKLNSPLAGQPLR